MADLSDKITDVRNATRPVSTTVAAPRTGGGTTLTAAALTGWPTASKIHGVTYQTDSNSNPVAGTQLDFEGIVSGSAITQFTVIDGTDTGNSIGDIVEMLPTAAWGQDLADALTSEHNRDGTHKNVTTDTLSVSSGTTLPAGDIGTADLAAASVTASKLATGAQTATVDTDQTTTSTSFTDLSTAGAAVTVTVGVNGLALVALYSRINNDGANFNQVGFEVSGATTQAASDNYSLTTSGTAVSRLGVTFLLTGLTPGSTTFTMKYKVSGGTGTFGNRRLSVVPL